MSPQHTRRPGKLTKSVNINVNDPKVTTTGPASLDPDTGKPYGMSFPVVSIRDFVNVQKALVESLGISKLKAVVGPSMGALQAYEWATAYPEMVERIVPVIGAAGGDPFLIAWLDIWAQPIRTDLRSAPLAVVKRSSSNTFFSTIIPVSMEAIMGFAPGACWGLLIARDRRRHSAVGRPAVSKTCGAISRRRSSSPSFNRMNALVV